MLVLLAVWEALVSWACQLKKRWDIFSVSPFSFLTPKHKAKLPVNLNKYSVHEAQRIKINNEQIIIKKEVNNVLYCKWKKSINKKTYWNRFRHSTVKEKLKKKWDSKESASVSSHITQSMWVRLVLREDFMYYYQ